MWDQNSGIEEAIRIRHLSRGYSKIFRPLDIFLEGGPAGRQGAQMREKESGYRRSVARKVAVAKIVEKTNPEKGGGDSIEEDRLEKKRRSEEKRRHPRKKMRGRRQSFFLEG